MVSNTIRGNFHHIIYIGEFASITCISDENLITTFKISIPPIIAMNSIIWMKSNNIMFSIYPAVITPICLYAQFHHFCMERITFSIKFLISSYNIVKN